MADLPAEQSFETSQDEAIEDSVEGVIGEGKSSEEQSFVALQDEAIEDSVEGVIGEGKSSEEQSFVALQDEVIEDSVEGVIGEGKSSEEQSFVALQDEVIEDSPAVAVVDWETAEEHNFLLPIHQLPPELLSEIILFVLEPWNNSGGAEGYFEELLDLQDVSSRWFHTIQCTPQLWSYLRSDAKIRTTKLFLERSKDAPLYIWCPQRTPKTRGEEFLDLVLPQMHRWRSFSSLSRVLVEKSLHLFSNRSAPVLERFQVIDGNSPGSELADERELDMLFANYAPRLRNLDIRSLIIPWDCKFLSGLVDLSIVAREKEAFPDVAAYFAILISCPALEGLHLIGGCRWKDGCTRRLEAEKREIRLPRLRSMILENLHPAIIGTLLSCISGVTFSNFLLDVTADPLVWHADPRLDHTFPPFLCELDGVMPWLIRSLHWLDIGQIKTGGRLEIFGGKWINSCTETLLKVDLVTTEDPLPALIRTLFPPNLTSLTSLSLSGHALFVDGLIAGRLKALDCLQCLHIIDASEDGAHGILEALNPFPSAPGGQIQWPCPVLKKLRLHDSPFKIEQLLATIKARQGPGVKAPAGQGLPLEELELGRNEVENMNPRVVDEVEEIVTKHGKFQWPYRSWVRTNYRNI